MPSIRPPRGRADPRFRPPRGQARPAAPRRCARRGRGRGGRCRSASAGPPPGDPEVSSHPHLRVLESVERLARRQVWVGSQVRARNAWKGGHPGRLQRLGGGPAIPVPAPRPDDAVEVVLVRLAPGRVREPGIGGKLRPADRPAKRLPFGLPAGRDRDPFVLPAAAVDVAGSRFRIAVSRRRVRFAAERMVHPSLEGGADHRLPHRDVDHLSAFAPVVPPVVPMEVAGEQRSGDRDRGVHPSVGVAVGHVDVARAAVLGISGLGGEARQRRDEGAVSGVEPQRPVLPESGDEGHRDLRVEGQQLGRPEPHALEDPGAEIGDEDVAPGRETPDQGAALGLREIDPDALLVLPEVVEVAVAVRPGRKLARVDRRAAGEVEPLRRLDLEHLRPEGAEDRRAVRPRPDPREVEHPDSGERSRIRFTRRGDVRCPARFRSGPGEQAADLSLRLAEGGGGTGDPPPATPEAIGRSGQLDRPRPRMVHRHEEVPRPQMLLRAEPRIVEYRRGPDPNLLERVEHLLRAPPPRPRRHPLADLGRVRPPVVTGPEQLARRPFRLTDQRRHPLPLSLLGADDERLAVAARVEAHRLVDGTVAPVVDAPRVLEGGEVPAEEEGDGLLHGDVEVIAEPCRPRGPAGGERSHRRVEPGLDEGVMPERADRRPLPRRAPTGDDVAPAARVHQGKLVPSPAPARSGEAERSDGDHHEPGMTLAPAVRVFEIRRVPLTDREVRPREEVFEGRPVGGPRPVEDDAALVGVEVEKGPAGRGAPARNDTPAAHRIAFRGLDLDHLRAEIRERLPGARRGEAAPDLDDRQAFEPLPHRRPPCRHPTRKSHRCPAAYDIGESPGETAIIAAGHPAVGPRGKAPARPRSVSERARRTPPEPPRRRETAGRGATGPCTAWHT